MAQEKVEGWKEKLENALNEKNAFTDLLAKVEDKTKVKRLYLVLGLGAITVLWLMIGYGAQFLANFIGFLYPAYASIKAIESPAKDDDKRWLTYWVVYSIFSLVEYFTDIFLFWIPFYWLLKCLFMVYCMVPTSWSGSIMIYERIIRPFILKHSDEIDRRLNQAAGVASDFMQEASKMLKRGAGDAEDIATDVTKKATEVATDHLIAGDKKSD